MKTIVNLVIAIIFVSTAHAQDELTWQYHNTVDEMSEVETKFASVLSSNKVDLSFPYDKGTRCMLNAMKVNGTVKFFLNVGNGQIKYRTGDAYRIRMDDQEPIYYKVIEFGDDNKLVVVENSAKLYGMMIGAKTMKVEIPMVYDGDRIFEFDVSDFDYDRI
jgi:hypothetical protein